MRTTTFDTTAIVMSNNSHLVGTVTSVIQKKDQGTGRLTSGTIAEILTHSSYHPRGIKVRLANGTVGRISSRTDNTEDNDDSNRPQMSQASLYYSHLYNNDDTKPRQNSTLADYMNNLSLTNQESARRQTLAKQNSTSAYFYTQENERAQKEQEAVDLSAYRNTQMGQSCTLADFHTQDYERAQKKQEVVDQSKDWDCSVCTFTNSGLLPKCEMCENFRDTNHR